MWRTLFSLVTLYILTGFSGRHSSIQGKWTADGDPKSVMIITGKKYINIYNTDTISAGSYQRSNRSCDKKYLGDKDSNDNDFVSFEDGRCFEIVGITKKKLTFRYTTSGKLITFHR